MAIWILKSGNQYATKNENGRIGISPRAMDAFVFATREEALTSVKKMFFAKLQPRAEVVQIAGEMSAKVANNSLEKAIQKGGIAWTDREDADEIIHGIN